MKNLARKSVVFFAAFALQAAAQNRVCIGGDLDHLTKAEKAACWTSANQVKRAATRFSAPGDWHFFVVCSASDWRDYAAYSRKTADELASVGADTNLQAHTTFFRGDWLLSADGATVNRMVANEVASAIMSTNDKRMIQRMVALWIPDEGGNQPILEAAR